MAQKTIQKEKNGFFLTRHEKVSECRLGEEVMVLANFSGIQAGMHGHVMEIYSLGPKEKPQLGVMVEWEDKGFLRDGFSEDELEYLAFGTRKPPTV